MKSAFWSWLGLLLGLEGASFAQAADLPQTTSPPPPVFTQPVDPWWRGWELRAGLAASTWAAEKGEVNFNGDAISPRLFKLDGWVHYFVPRWEFGGTANFQGGTSYIYTGPLWEVDFNRYFVDLSIGGAIHDGQLNYGPGFDPSRNVLGCRLLYHTAADVGYKFDDHWSGMVTFDHISNGAGTLSDCKINQGATILGVRIGYTF